MKKILILIMLPMAFISCKENKEVIIEKEIIVDKVNVDSLSKVFVDSWNAGDSAAIMATMASNCIVMNDSVIHNGADAIAAGWVSGGVKVLSNIAVSSMQKGSSALVAYDAGTYSLDLTIPNGPKLKEKGNYSLAWERQEDKSWKLTMVHIEDITRMPNVE